MVLYFNIQLQEVLCSTSRQHMCIKTFLRHENGNTHYKCTSNSLSNTLLGGYPLKINLPLKCQKCRLLATYVPDRENGQADAEAENNRDPPTFVGRAIIKLK